MKDIKELLKIILILKLLEFWKVIEVEKEQDCHPVLFIIWKTLRIFNILLKLLVVYYIFYYMSIFTKK